MKKIILASRSVDRSELLKRAKIPFEIIFSNIEEEYYKRIISNPYQLVKELAKAKVLDVKQRLFQKKEDALIIAADTIVELKGKILGKANNKEQAFQILNKLSNNSHNLITGFAITDVIGPKLVCGYDQTIVYFSNITEREINQYIESDEWMGRAGAYSIRDKAALFIDSIEGSFSNVIGLPLNKIFKVLKKEFNLNLLEL
ncbi:MAG: septum formation protein Maf [Candidatus Lokiarchaeota archaeon]|nr:septum formation protein Maf [Candidatus Lokiarchaeota archaeon]